jgi:hypothetical protein
MGRSPGALPASDEHTLHESIDPTGCLFPLLAGDAEKPFFAPVTVSVGVDGAVESTLALSLLSMTSLPEILIGLDAGCFDRPVVNSKNHDQASIHIDTHI